MDSNHQLKLLLEMWKEYLKTIEINLEDDVIKKTIYLFVDENIDEIKKMPRPYISKFMLDASILMTTKLLCEEQNEQ